jgi:protein-L-isoaspartate O-methyltransferase
MGLTGRASLIADVMRKAAQLDRDWMRKVPEDVRNRRLYTPWMPFSIPAFVALLAEALPEVPGDRFLEVGCGPGSKMLIAREIFGLDVHGVERSDEMAAAARTLGLDAETADAAAWDGYGKHDVVWFNRPFRDPGTQQQLEDLVWRDMAPGAVVIVANLEHPPPSQWLVVLDDWEIRRGIYMKPLASG